MRTEEEAFSLITRSLMDVLIMFTDWTFNDDGNKKTVAYKEMGYYTKTMIDNFEDAVLNKAFAEWFEHNNFALNAAKHNMIILIYLYYLSLKEELVTSKQREFATDIAKNNRKVFHFLYFGCMTDQAILRVNSLKKSATFYSHGKSIN